MKRNSGLTAAILVNRISRDISIQFANLFGKIDLLLLLCRSRACSATNAGKTLTTIKFWEENVRAKLLESDPEIVYRRL